MALSQRLAALQNAPLQAVVDDVFPANVPACADVRVLALAAMTNAADAKALLEELKVLIVQPEIPGSQGNSVRIMSLHKSKGLTARLVIVAGCMAGILPMNDNRLLGHDHEKQERQKRRSVSRGVNRVARTLG